MAKKRKKHPRLPNGYGSIRYLGSRRNNEYAVHPPADRSGKRPPALCYVDDWMKGFIILTAYKAGTYTPGMESTLELGTSENLDIVVGRILADYNRVKGIEPNKKGKTFEELFSEYYKNKFGVEYGHSGKKKSMENSMVSAFKNCETLHKKEFSLLVANDLQENLDACPLKYSSLENIKTLYHQMYFYASKNDLCEKDYSKFVVINKEDDDEHGVPFSDEELSVLGKSKEDPTVEMILIMCYSGFRIAAYQTLKVDLDSKLFQGGVKTRASKERIVPIHSSILALVQGRVQRYNKLMPSSTSDFRESMYETLSRIGIEKHTPHDCRHTFSRLCEEYHVRENDRKRLLGHAFADITNRIYGHRTPEELRTEIEKIKAP